MHFGKRFIFALSISLGLANSAMAAPISLNLSQADVLVESARNSFVNVSALPDNNIKLATLNLSYGIEQQDKVSNFLKAETIKTDAHPINVPEPSALLLLGLGLLGLTILRRRKH